MNTHDGNNYPSTSSAQAQKHLITPPRAPTAPLASPFKTPDRVLPSANMPPPEGMFFTSRATPHLESTHHHLSSLAGPTSPHTPVRQQDVMPYHLPHANWSEPVRKSTVSSYPGYSSAHMDKRLELSRVAQQTTLNGFANHGHQPAKTNVQGQQYPVHHQLDAPIDFTGATTVGASGPAHPLSTGQKDRLEASKVTLDSNNKRKPEDVDDHQVGNQDKKKAKGLAYIDVDHSLAPSNFVEVDEKNPPKAAISPFPSSATAWPSHEKRAAFRQSMLIRPSPTAGDKGLPHGPYKLDKIDALVKRIYDALTFTKFYWGSKAPLNRYLKGEVSTDWVCMRAEDVVLETIKFHTNGLPASWNVLDSKNASTKDDDFESRFADIEKTLTYSKDVAMDVILGRTELLWALILSPKGKFEDKNAYKASNDGRGVQTKVTKEQAKEFKKLKEQHQVNGSNNL